MKHFFNVVVISAICVVVSTGAKAQDDRERQKLNDNEEIIIMKKGDKDTKLTIEIKGADVLVNGKPLSDFNEEGIVIRKRRMGPMVLSMPRSPFRDTLFLNKNLAFNYKFAPNKAVLGVAMEKHDEGAKITKVTKDSPAEKAGLKENDVITNIDENVITTPDDLIKVIGKLKPEAKAVVTYKRDKKEQKVTVTLAKNKSANSYSQNFDFSDLNLSMPGVEGYGSIIRGQSPRLGIKAQDTEDGKGVKVLDIDERSNAEKAGVKEGDIITEFNGKAVNSAPELAEAAREARDKSPLKIKLNRNGKAHELEIKIPKKLKTANL